jgi:aerotaxis receptor
MASNRSSSTTTINKISHFENAEVFFSRTHRNGVIVSGNAVFARVSKYPISGMIKKAHSIVRHPDMPRAVFKIMWDEILAGRSISAYVKNRASDGSYYWVLANVYIYENDFVSVRFKPTSSLLAEKIEPLYRKLRAMEASTSLDNQVAALLDGLKELGFETYQHFMRTAFNTELSLVLKDILKIEIPENDVCDLSNRIQGAIFEVLSSMDRASTEIQKLSKVFADLAKITRAQDLLPFNLTLSTQNSNLTQKTMEVLSRLFAQQQSEAKAFLEEFQGVIAAAEHSGLAPIRYQVGSCFLQSSAVKQFLLESFSDKEEAQYKMAEADALRESLDLIRMMQLKFENTLKDINELRSRFIRIMSKREEMEALTKSVLSIAQLGMVEISHDPAAKNSALPHLNQMRKMAEDLNQKILEMGMALKQAASGLDQSSQTLIKSNRSCVQMMLKVQHKQLANSKAA